VTGPPTFYVGISEAGWLWRPELADRRVFVSYACLSQAVRYRPATGPYAVDSSAFSILSRPPHRWTVSPETYVEALYRYRAEIGPFDFAASQDSMCEPWILDAIETETGRRPTVAEHQDATVANYLRLRDLAPDLPIMPTLQGWEDPEDYLRCAELYRRAGVDLTALPRVGVGSVCRQQDTRRIELIFDALAPLGLRLHGFGVKSGGFRRYAHRLTSADSHAWSYGARRRRIRLPGHTHASCHNCPTYAALWAGERELDLVRAHRAPRQETLDVFTEPLAGVYTSG
jgi:hypothetical protein